MWNHMHVHTDATDTAEGTLGGIQRSGFQAWLRFRCSCRADEMAAPFPVSLLLSPLFTSSGGVIAWSPDLAQRSHDVGKPLLTVSKPSWLPQQVIICYLSVTRVKRLGLMQVFSAVTLADSAVYKTCRPVRHMSCLPFWASPPPACLLSDSGTTGSCALAIRPLSCRTIGLSAFEI